MNNVQSLQYETNITGSALSGVFLHGLSQGLGLRKWKPKFCSCFLFVYDDDFHF